MLNVARDPRFGRSYECYSEDPFVIFSLGQSYIAGMQYGPGAAAITPDQNPRGLKKMGSAAKHFAAYNFEGCVGHEQYPHCSQYRTSFNAIVSDQDLQETYYYAWRRLAPELSGFMCSTNAVNGVPMCANKLAIKTLMRGTWNFTGVVVSDGGTVSGIGPDDRPTIGRWIHGHSYAKNTTAAVADALEAGCDLEWDTVYASDAQAAVDQGLTTEATLSAAVRRTLSNRLRLGQFDIPRENPWDRLNLGVVDSAAHRSLAWRAAASSAVLLENAPDARGLPIAILSSNTVIAILGAQAAQDLVGRRDYSGSTTKTVSILSGIQSRAAADADAEVRYSVDDVNITVGANVVVVVVQSEQEGESHDRANLTLRAEDTATLLKLQQRQHHLGSACKVVVVVVSGGPVDTSQPTAVMGDGGVVSSVIASWWLGEEGGNAIAALLWGDVDFSAALAVTVYRQNFTKSVGITNISEAGHGYRYLHDDSLQLYPFGYGLSYARWATTTLLWGGDGAPPKVRASDFSGNVNVTVTVRNLGARVASRPVLLFIQLLESRGGGGTTGLLWPRKWLVAFGKAKDVVPGGEHTLALGFGAAEISRWVPDAGVPATAGRFAVVPGDYLLTVIDQCGEPCANLTLVVSV